jgi:putative ABC transport system permease protein
VTAETTGAALAATPVRMRRAGLALRLAMRDLRGGVRGFRVFLGCLAVGVAAIAAVLSISKALEEGIAAEGRFILGGDLAFSIIHRQADGDERGFMEGLGTVSEVASVRSMARAGAAEPVMVELKAVDDRYPLYGELALRPAGPLGPALGERNGSFGIVVDETLLARLGTEVGQVISIGDNDYEIRAVIVR